MQALLRRTSVDGLFGAVLKSGAEDAGSVFVVINHLNGSYTLLEPPPGPAYDEAGERRFVVLKQNLTSIDITQRIEKERRFDSDQWFVEIEDKNGLAGLKPEIV